MSKEYYSILWVPKTATQDEIKKAYRKKAMEHHPDRWWDGENFKEINEAYSILSDENKKREYDTYWRVWWSPFWNSWFSGMDVDLWDIFEQFFWWNNKNSRRKRSDSFAWEDLEYIMQIDLKTSVIWWKQTIKYEKYIVCDNCHWEWWKWKKTCPDCRGSWQVKYRQQTMFWTIEHTGTCGTCNWTWEKIDEICTKCRGQKRVKTEINYELDIPAWIDDGMVIKITWEWNDWVKWQAWDLYVKFKLNSIEKNLSRRWSNLYYDLEVDLIEAILWTSKEINIPIIWKRIIDIEAWTQVWTTIKISWDGVKYIDRDKKWDLFINLNIKIPKKLSVKERELYDEIAKDKKINVHNKKWIFEKIFG